MWYPIIKQKETKALTMWYPIIKTERN
jgi:hypothetical protein